MASLLGTCSEASAFSSSSAYRAPGVPEMIADILKS